MSHTDTSLDTLCNDVAAMEHFHDIRDAGMDIFNPNDHPDITYLRDPCHASIALRYVTTLLDELLPKKRFVISKSQETSQGLIKRLRNANTEVVEFCAGLTHDDFAGFQINPEIEAILRVNAETGVGLLTHFSLNHRVQGKSVHEHYLAYLHRLKREFDQPELRRLRRNLKTNERRRIASVHEQINDALSLCRRARLIRVDGSYRESVRDSVTADRIAADLDHLIANMEHNRKNFAGLVLAVFKLEFGQYKGFHWHGYFIYDGDLVYQDVLKGKYILDYWIDVITQGEGSGYNGNSGAAKDQLANRLQIHTNQLALGEYRPDDAIQQQNRNTLIAYLAKCSEQRIRVTGDKAINRLRIVKGPRYRVLNARRAT